MYRWFASLFYIGFASIISQILLLREFLVLIHGNELSIGIIYANWLIWIGIGSIIGNKFIRNMYKSYNIFQIFLITAPVLVICQIVLVRFTRVFINVNPGEYISMLDLMLTSFLILCPGCILWGVLFTLGAKAMSNKKETLWYGVNMAYIFEVLGSTLGGILFSFCMASNLNNLQIVALLGLLSLNLFTWHKSHRKKLNIIILLLSSFLYLKSLPCLTNFEHFLESRRWAYINEKLEFISAINTKYQNLSLLKLGNQLIIYSDGKPSYNLANTYDAELFTHPIMIQRPKAKNILIIGGGFNGIIKEVLKYPVSSVDYIEIDPDLLKYALQFLDETNRQALNEPRVKMNLTDARLYLSKLKKKYDVILINIGEPSTASINRYYTVDFYKQCAQCLEPDGICAFTFTSSTEYIANELKDFNTSIYKSFKLVFNNTLIIPGVHAILIGTNSKQNLITQSDSLAQFFKNLNISTEYFNEYMLADLLQPKRVQYVTSVLDNTKGYKLNTDNDPVTYYFDLLLWHKLQLGSNNLFTILDRKNLLLSGLVLCFLTFLFLLITYSRKKVHQLFPQIIMAYTGLSGMALNLLLILNFQTTFGSIYEMVGAVISANMIGMAFGALLSVLLMKKLSPKILLFTGLLTYGIFIIFIPELLKILTVAQKIAMTFSAVIVLGMFIGTLFGLLNRLYLTNSMKVGNIYAFDVVGSSVGALIACSILLPVLGASYTSIFLFILFAPSIIAGFIIKNIK